MIYGIQLAIYADGAVYLPLADGSITGIQELRWVDGRPCPQKDGYLFFETAEGWVMKDAYKEGIFRLPINEHRMLLLADGTRAPVLGINYVDGRPVPIADVGYEFVETTEGWVERKIPDFSNRRAPATPATNGEGK